MWLAEAEYADGESITRWFAYDEHDNYQQEGDRIHEIEEWLIQKHDDCTWYSVTFIPEENIYLYQ